MKTMPEASGASSRWLRSVSDDTTGRQMRHKVLRPCRGASSFFLDLLTGRCRFAQPPATSFEASGIILLRDVSFLTATSLHSGRAHGKIIFGRGTSGPDQLPARLFHLEDDLGEKTDVANANPEKVAELIRLMEWLIARGQTTSGSDHQNDAPFEATRTSQKQGQGKVPPVSCSGQIRLINQISRARQGLLSA